MEAVERLRKHTQQCGPRSHVGGMDVQRLVAASARVRSVGVGVRTLLRDRNLLLVISSGMISQLGDWALLLAPPLFVYARTRSISSTGALVAVQLLPRLVGSPLAGVLADRWNRRLTLVGADAFRAAVVLVLAVAPAGGPIWLVSAVALLEASASQLFVAADAALLPTIVRRENLLRANSLLSVGTSTIRSEERRV